MTTKSRIEMSVSAGYQKRPAAAYVGESPFLDRLKAGD
jgi:hypothetical protein